MASTVTNIRTTKPIATWACAVAFALPAHTLLVSNGTDKIQLVWHIAPTYWWCSHSCQWPWGTWLSVEMPWTWEPRTELLKNNHETKAWPGTSLRLVVEPTLCHPLWLPCRQILWETHIAVPTRTTWSGNRSVGWKYQPDSWINAKWRHFALHRTWPCQPSETRFIAVQVKVPHLVELAFWCGLGNWNKNLTTITQSSHCLAGICKWPPLCWHFA